VGTIRCYFLGLVIPFKGYLKFEIFLERCKVLLDVVGEPWRYCCYEESGMIGRTPMNVKMIRVLQDFPYAPSKIYA
jgi:hypothetical protein